MGKRAERARELFYEGYNCCQSVVGAFADLFGVDFSVAVKSAEGLGAGLGRMRLTCGAVSGAAIVAGMKESSGKPGDLKGRAHVYSIVQSIANDFKAANGSIVCAELLGAALPKDGGTTPEARTPEYYKKRPCPECIYQCALLVEKYLYDGKEDI